MNNKKSKRKTKRKSTSKSKLVKIFLLIFLFAFIATATSYFLINTPSSNKNIPVKKTIVKDIPPSNTNRQENTKIQEKYEEITEESKKDFDEIKKEIKEKKKHQEESKKTIEKTTKEAIKKVVVKKEKTKRDTYHYNKNNKPRLAVIIDDVSSNKQKQAILNVGYPITMAFLPPQKGHSNSAKIAQDLAVHMIHIPMQASPKFKSTEKVTLNINDSYEKIEAIVKKLRKLYPKVKYTNNHTGSVFTQNDIAMDRLFKALKKYDFVFVDSRTTAKSVAKKYAIKYDMPYIVRNTFLDNKKDFAYIQNQLKKAIKISKKRGYAIAIGHPHSMTLKVLKESKHLLQDIELIFINKIPYL